MDYLIICLAAFLGSGLTLFSGFGLGTILVPVFAIFFPIDTAIALTAIVHFLNNLFKLILLGKQANKDIIVRFGIPAIIAAFFGAWLLSLLTNTDPLMQYELAGKHFTVTFVKLTIAGLLMVFVLFDIVPWFMKLQFDKKYLPLGGLLSGFFGGLSGNQGALRTAFLIRANLSKEAFIASGVAIACLVDISRLTVYFRQIYSQRENFNFFLILAATLAAFSGAYFGNLYLKKVTIKTIQYLVAIMLFIFALLLGIGLI